MSWTILARPMGSCGGIEPYIIACLVQGAEDSSANATDGEEGSEACDGELKSEPASTAAAAANAARAAAAARAASRLREEEMKRRSLEEEAVGATCCTSSLPALSFEWRHTV